MRADAVGATVPVQTVTSTGVSKTRHRRSISIPVPTASSDGSAPRVSDVSERAFHCAACIAVTSACSNGDETVRRSPCRTVSEGGVSDGLVLHEAVVAVIDFLAPTGRGIRTESVRDYHPLVVHGI